MEFKMQRSSKIDTLIWVLIIGAVIVGIGLNYYYSGLAFPLRLAGWVVLTIALGAFALQTQQGRAVWQFLRETRMELRKVVWPTRPEVVQTTLLVVGMVTLMSLMLWAVDSILLWIIAILTGQRG